MLLIIILFVAFYILAYTLLKNWDSFKWGGTFDGNQMGFAIFATVVVAVIVNVTSLILFISTSTNGELKFPRSGGRIFALTRHLIHPNARLGLLPCRRTNVGISGV